jgi:hypothetical protein
VEGEVSGNGGQIRVAIKSLREGELGAQETVGGRNFAKQSF